MERESRRRRFLHPIAISLLFSVLGCATPPAPSLSTPTALAYGDTAAMTRELILGSSREVRLEALGVTFRVPTDHEVEHQALEHFDNVYFDIGTELPVACQIHHRRKDLANFLAYQPSHPLDPPTRNSDRHIRPVVGRAPW